MSSSICASCKNECSCTFPRNQLIVQCEEYDYSEPRSIRQTLKECVPASLAATRGDSGRKHAVAAG